MNELPKYFLFCLLFSFGFSFSQNAKIDSLEDVVAKSKEDTSKINTLHELSWELYSTGDYAEAKFYADEVLKLGEKLNYKKGISKAYNTIGNIYLNQGNYPEALKYQLSALKIREELGDKKGVGNLYNNIGLIYFYQDNHEEALKNYSVSLKIKEETGDQYGLAGTYNNVAIVYEEQGNYSESLKNLFASRKIFETLSDKQGMATAYSNIGHIQERQGNYYEAMQNYFSALRLQEEIGEKEGIVISFINLGEASYRLKKSPDAREYYDKALAVAGEIKSKERLKDCYKGLAELDSSAGNFEQAYAYYKMYTAYKDSISNEENIRKTVEEQMQYEFDKKEAVTKVEQEKQAAENRKQKIIIWFAVFGLLFAVLFAGFIFRSLKLTRKQKTIIEEKNKDITDSINYAQRIQRAILLPEVEIKKHFTDAFVLFKPKDIVSGDFYFFAESKYNKVLAVADCTGHGVPGGFMSMLGFDMLQETLLLEEMKTTADAFTALDKKITDTLNRNDRSHRDGMDIVLCAFSKSSNKLQFSCANRPLVLIRKGEVKEFSSDKYSLGGGIDNIEKTFRNQEIETEQGDMIYIFSDGYADQFGGPREKKFMYRKLVDLLHSISPTLLVEQKKTLDAVFENWKGNSAQIDDVLVIGIKV